jgi:hypothetical protein
MRKSYVKILIFVLILTANYVIFYKKLHRENQLEREIDNEFHLNSNCKCKNEEKLVIKKKNDRIRVYLGESLYPSQSFNHEQYYNFKFTCNLYNEFRRGPKQKIFSYTLFGTNKKFYKKIKSIALKVGEYMPDWSIRIYHDDNYHMRDFLCGLECEFKNLDLCNVNELHLTWEKYLKNENFKVVDVVHATMWRWLALGSSFVDVMSSITFFLSNVFSIFR